MCGERGQVELAELERLFVGEGLKLVGPDGGIQAWPGSSDAERAELLSVLANAKSTGEPIDTWIVADGGFLMTAPNYLASRGHVPAKRARIH